MCGSLLKCVEVLSSSLVTEVGRYFIYDSYSVMIYRFLQCSLSSSVPRYLACFSVLAHLSVLDYLSVLAYPEVGTW